MSAPWEEAMIAEEAISLYSPEGVGPSDTLDDLRLPDRPRLARTLAEILKDPAALKPPEAVVPRLGWKGRITLLAAREKLGKSTLAAMAAARVSAGADFLGEECPAVPVLWAGLEEAIPDAARRFHDFGADSDQIHMLDRLPRPFRDLQAEAKACEAGLVVIDSLAALTQELVSDPGSSAAWTPVMNKLTRLARDSGAAVLVLHHARKSDGAYRDSSAIGAGVDVILEMRDEGGSTVRAFKPRGRWKLDPFSVRFDGQHYWLVSDDQPLDRRVLEFVQQNPGCSLREIRDSVSGKSLAISEAVKAAKDAGMIENKGSAREYALHATKPV